MVGPENQGAKAPNHESESEQSTRLKRSQQKKKKNPTRNKNKDKNHLMVQVRGCGDSALLEAQSAGTQAEARASEQLEAPAEKHGLEAV